jgi:hypothetical protein
MKMTTNRKGEIRATVDRIGNVFESQTNNFMELFKSSGLSNDTFKGEVMEGWDLSHSDLSSLDLTDTVLMNCKIDGTIFPNNFDPAKQIQSTGDAPKTPDIIINHEPE